VISYVDEALDYVGHLSKSTIRMFDSFIFYFFEDLFGTTKNDKIKTPHASKHFG